MVRQSAEVSIGLPLPHHCLRRQRGRSQHVVGSRAWPPPARLRTQLARLCKRHRRHDLDHRQADDIAMCPNQSTGIHQRQVLGRQIGGLNDKAATKHSQPHGLHPQPSAAAMRGQLHQLVPKCTAQGPAPRRVAKPILLRLARPPRRQDRDGHRPTIGPGARRSAATAALHDTAS